MKQVTIYTDGACSGNPGVGGWAAVLEYKGKQQEISGSDGELPPTEWKCMPSFRHCEL